MSAPSLTDRVALLTANTVPPRVREEMAADWEDIALLTLGIADRDHELSPVGDSTVVFCDSAFADDMARTNPRSHPGAARSRRRSELVR